MMKATDKQSIIIACVFPVYGVGLYGRQRILCSIVVHYGSCLNSVCHIQRADAFFDRIAKVRQ